MLRAVRAAVSIPVIASGGAGAVEDFAPAVDAGADAVLAASVFHFGELTIARSRPPWRQKGSCAMTDLDPGIAARLKRNAEGLFTAVQQRGTGDVLMVAWMDDAALARTSKPGKRRTSRARAVSSGSRADLRPHAACALGTPRL